MPVYEYRCPSCGSEVERYEPYINRALPPLHHGVEMAKVISAPWLEFWGEGAYATEYGPQWRNKWGKDHIRKHEGTNFNAAEHVKTLPKRPV